MVTDRWITFPPALPSVYVRGRARMLPWRLERVTRIELASSTWKAEVITIRPYPHGGGKAGKQPDRNRLPSLPDPLESAQEGKDADSTEGVCRECGFSAGKRACRQSSATRSVHPP